MAVSLGTYGLCFSLALATPHVALPINSQVPPVARVDQPFNYRFASNTFQSSSGASLEYSLQAAPSWLQLDGNTRTFSGTPTLQDLGPCILQLSAADAEGTVGLQVILIVLNGTNPTFSGDISATLARSGILSAPTSLVLRPDTQFDIAFDRSLFHSDTDLFFYATSEDRSPLPSWVVFDVDKLSLSGTTPPPAAAPRSYGLDILASSVRGFSEVQVGFDIQVSNHVLQFKAVEQTLQVAAGDSIHFDVGSSIVLDMDAIDPNQVKRIQVTGPSWVTLDNASLTLQGQAPAQATITEVDISVWDNFDDKASMKLRISISSETISSLGSTMTVSTRAPTSSTTSPSSLSANRSDATDTPGVSPTDLSMIPKASGSEGKANPHLSAGEIAATVIVPVFVIVLLTLVCICLRRRRQKCPREIGEEELRGAGNSGTDAQRGRLGHAASWLPPIVGLGGTAPQDGTNQSTRVREKQDQMQSHLAHHNSKDQHSRTAEESRISEAFASAKKAWDNSTAQNHPLQSHPDTGCVVADANKGNAAKLKSGGIIPISDMAVIEDGILVWPRPRPGSVAARVLPGAGHGRAPATDVLPAMNRYSDPTSSYYGPTTADGGTARSSRASMTHQIVRRSTLAFQRLSTIRKVASSSDTSSSSRHRSFSERRQSFINRRASNPSRPLFSAGPLETSKASSEPLTQALHPSPVRTLQEQVHKPDFGARYPSERAAKQSEDTQAGSLETMSSVWEDVDSNSSDTQDADHGSILIAEEASSHALEQSRQAGSCLHSDQVTTSQGAEAGAIRILPDAGPSNLAFL